MLQNLWLSIFRPFSSQDGVGSTLHHDGFLESLFAGCSQFLSENSWILPCWTSRMWSLSTRRLEFGGLNLQAFQVAFAEQQTCSIECTLCTDVLPFVSRQKMCAVWFAIVWLQRLRFVMETDVGCCGSSVGSVW